MKTEIALAITLSAVPLASCSRQPVVFDGVSWGMSKNEVRTRLRESDISLFYEKGHPIMDEDGNFSMFEDELMYIRQIPGEDVKFTVRYYFGKDNELNKMDFDTGEIWDRTSPVSPPNPQFKTFADKKRFRKFEGQIKALLFDTTNAELVDEAYNFPDPDYSEIRIVYDKIYKTPNANIRVKLKRSDDIGIYFGEELTLVPSDQMWRNMPSETKAAAKKKSP
jgi:hypothetical protein